MGNRLTGLPDLEIREPSKADIEKILFDEEIYKRISDDRCPPRSVMRWIFPYSMFKYRGIFLGDEIVGLGNIDRNSKFHFAFLKKYRLLARKGLKMILDDKEFCQMYQDNIWCEIPIIYKGVINFAKRSGFVEKGLGEGVHILEKNTYPTIKLNYS